MSRSAEDVFLRQEAERLAKPTGTLFEDNMRKYAVECAASTNDKRKAKNAKARLITVWPHYGKNDARDKWQGTDFKMLDRSGRIAPFAGHLRIDFTHSFEKKLDDYMPLLAEPDPPIQINGLPLKFGIRVGNSKKGLFREPVIVVGIDAKPERIKGLEEVGAMKSFKAGMKDIIPAAGRVLQQFMLYGDADYRAFAEKKGLADPKVKLRVNMDSRRETLAVANRPSQRGPMADMVKAVVPSAGPNARKGGTPSDTPWLDKLNARMAEVDEAEAADQREIERRYGHSGK